MTTSAALYTFFSQFGISAYEATKVPDNAVMPYLTYTETLNEFDAGDVSCAVNLYYYESSNANINAKAKAIGDMIGRGGKALECDGGYLWIKKGSPWCLTIADADSSVNRRLINITLEYLN